MSCAFAEEGGEIDAAYDRAAAAIADVRSRLRGAVPVPETPQLAEPPHSSRTWSARSSKRRSSGSSSTCTRATPSRSCPHSASRPRRRSRPSRSTGACAPSTPRRTCTSRVRRLPDRRRLTEPLVKVSRDRVETRPIAGTYPRGGDEEEDRPLAERLVNDPKERAEHVMLVDLGRNDLGRVCEYGSVEVDELMVVETYSHVLHIVSQVSGTLREGIGAMDVLRSALPAGHPLGAPKVRAMQIIDELEPVKRCSYGGAIGYLSWNGDLDTAIHIRTVVVKDGQIHVQAGGGTVADAKPAYEYNESVNKAKAVFRAVELACEQPDWA
jgi:anthranilate synthase component 1